MDTLLFKRTARLFARPSFFEGIARVIDIGSTLNEYNTNKTTEEADTESLNSDWQAVGEQLTFAMDGFIK